MLSYISQNNNLTKGENAMKAIEIPVWKKSNLTIQEAAAYFNIGEIKLREMISDEYYDCAIRNGMKVIIKRVKLEDALTDCVAI